MAKISCVIHTYNSEAYIEKCLRSVQWCDQIVIVDMHSTDNTILIAREYKAEIHTFENLGFADPARAFGLEKCTNDWVLALDSDEVVPKKLALELINIADKDLADVVRISFRNYFFGREIQGAGWGYKNQVIHRLFKKPYVKYGDQVHNFINIKKGSRIKKIINKDLSIIHYNYHSVEQFLSKLNNYTGKEVASTKYNYKGGMVCKMIYHFAREFFGRFILLKGYKDGWIGLYLSLAMVLYRWTAIAKANTSSKEEVIVKYNKEKIDVL